MKTIIKQAEFSPKLKIYVFLVAVLIQLVSIIGIAFLPIWLLGFGRYYCNKFYKNLKCVLTNKQLEFKKGVFNKVTKTIPLENIQDLTFIENPILKMLDLVIIKIETAGQSNPQGTDMKLIGIKNALDFKELVLSQREILQSKNNYPSQKNEENISSNELLKEIRDLLIEIKNK
jgi:putative membrane protein